MLDTRDPPIAFYIREIKVLAQAYHHATSYFEFAQDFGPLDRGDRRCLARLTVIAGEARRRLDKPLDTFIDAHVLSSEILDFFLMLRKL